MDDFASAHATGDTARAVGEALAEQLRGVEGHTVGFLYVTSDIAGELGEVVSALRARTGITTWTGTAGHGVCGSGIEYWSGPAATVLTGRLTKASCSALPSVATVEALEAMTDFGATAGLGVLHGDPRNGRVVELVEALSSASGAYLVGGLTSASDEFPQMAGERVVDGGISGVLIGGRFNVAVGLTQGCTPIGPVHEVTRCEGQIVAMLDHQPAYQVMCEDIGIAESADPRPWLANVHAAFPVEGSNEADYVVRNLIGIDPRQGLVAIAETMQPGDRVMFVRRDAESASKDLKRMLAALSSRLTGAPKAGLYYSCVARGPNLFSDEHYEMHAIRDAFGDIPIAGFFGNGEISDDRVYGYTGVLTLFS
ncbi:MAG: FIST N-terminal domain-containing protein [Hyphomicrobiaceae bacterium]